MVRGAREDTEMRWRESQSCRREDEGWRGRLYESRPRIRRVWRKEKKL